MKKIKEKINDLLVISSMDIDQFEEEGDKNLFDASLRKMKVQDDLIEEIRVLARQEGTLLGRIIKFPHADSHAIYIITKVNKKTVQVTWIDYCDGWSDDRLGMVGSLDIAYAEDTITGEDCWFDLMEAKKAS